MLQIQQLTSLQVPRDEVSVSPLMIHMVKNTPVERFLSS